MLQEFTIDGSPIQSGKTKRLLAAAATALADGKSVIIFTPPVNPGDQGRYKGLHYSSILHPFAAEHRTVQWHSYGYLREKTTEEPSEDVHIFCDDAHLAKGDILLPRAYYAFRPGENTVVTDPLWERWKALSPVPPSPLAAEEKPSEGLEDWDSNVRKLNQRVTDLLRDGTKSESSVAFAVDALRNYLAAGEFYDARVR